MKRYSLLFNISLLGVMLSPVVLFASSYVFDPVLSIPANASPRGVAVGNVYGNGIQSFLVANFGAPTFIGQNTPATLINTKNSNLQVFSPSPNGLQLVDTIPTACSPRGICLFDLYNRGRQDILTTAYDSNLIQVFSWQNGQFIKSDEKPTLKMPVGVAGGLTRPEGTAFIAVADYGDNNISLYPVKDGKLGKRVDIGTEAGPTQLAIGDLNGDGKNEIVVACLPSNKIEILTFNPTGRHDDVTSYTVTKTLDLPDGSAPSDLRIVDVNGDGLSDLVVSGFGKNVIYIYAQEKDGSLELQSTLPVSGSHPNGLTVGDLNGDGQKEIIVASRDSDLIDIFGIVSGQYQMVQSLKVADDSNSSMGPIEIGVLDTTGSGKLDLVTSHMRSNTIKVLSRVASEKIGHPNPLPTVESSAGSPFSEKTTYCYPNPSRDGKVTFSFTLSSPASVDIRIFDVTGTLVWTQSLNISQTRSGVNLIHWDCTNQSGENLASGLYLYRIQIGGQTVTKKVAIIH